MVRTYATVGGKTATTSTNAATSSGSNDNAMHIVSTLAFSASMMISRMVMLNSKKKQQQKQKRIIELDGKDSTARSASTTTGTTTDNNTSTDTAPGQLSSRGTLALQPILSYIDDFLQCFDDPCHHRDNPSGSIALCIAENKLTVDLLQQYFAKSCADTTPQVFQDPTIYGYNSFAGLPEARQAVADFLGKHFIKDTSGNEQPSPDNIIIGSGAGSLLHYLFYALGEAEDGCLIPSPYYAAFENDMNSVSKCVPIAVPMRTNGSTATTTQELEDAYQAATAKGIRVKFLLLTNPHNPLGVVYSPTQMHEWIAWSRSKGMHTIVDEIYALSVRSDFQSILNSPDDEVWGDDVHFVWALSKDFSASGFRIGVAVSQNEQLIAALSNLNAFSGVSHPMQMMMSKMLSDDGFTSTFLEESKKRLQRSYQICTSALGEADVPFVDAVAGIFVYADFSSLLSKLVGPAKPNSNGVVVGDAFDGIKAERIFGELLFSKCRIVLTPGQAQRDHRPGRFRICYAWQSVPVLQIAMRRLQTFIAVLRGVRSADAGDLNLIESLLDEAEILK